MQKRGLLVAQAMIQLTAILAQQNLQVLAKAPASSIQLGLAN